MKKLFKGNKEDFRNIIDKINKNLVEVDFDSYLETHFEIVSYITNELNKDKPNDELNIRYENQGIGGMYELSKELTDEFEDRNKDRIWDGDFFDEIEHFLNNKFK